MAERIDMSLDDIIKRDRTGRGARRGNKFSNRSTTGAGGSSSRGRGGVRPRKIAATARPMKAGTRRTGGSFANRTSTRNMPEKWDHDKFSSDAKSSALMVSNLHYSVSDGDLKELFGSFGPLKKASVHYDSSGRSLGKADVIFTKPVDAIKALKKYNGVPLDGRPMLIETVSTPGMKKSIASRIGSAPITGGFKKTRAPPGRGATRGRGGGATRGGRGRSSGGAPAAAGRRGPKKMPTQAELDADLDAFNNKMM